MLSNFLVKIDIYQTLLVKHMPILEYLDIIYHPNDNWYRLLLLGNILGRSNCKKSITDIPLYG